MSTAVERAKPEQPWESDPWRFGWRYVQVPTPDGGYRTKQVPLTEEDVLHPQEGDFIMENPAHDRDCDVLKNALQSRFRDRPDVVVLRDCRVDWGVAGIEPHGADAVVLEGVDEWDPNLGTFHVAEHHARVILVVEITSPSTRRNDLGVKVDEYFRAGIPLYVIVDAPVVNGVRTIRMIGRQATETGYVFMPVDAQGRLWLEPVGLWLSADHGQLVCTDAEGNRLGEFLEAVQAAEAARQRADAAQQLADAEKARAEAEKARAEAEAQARQIAQAEAEALRARLLQLEAELQKRENPPS
jgi:Uma2 family endonuclease